MTDCKATRVSQEFIEANKEAIMGKGSQGAMAKAAPAAAADVHEKLRRAPKQESGLIEERYEMSELEELE